MLSENGPQNMNTMISRMCTHTPQPNTYILCKFYIKRKNAGWHDSMVGRTFAAKPYSLSLIPRIHILEEQTDNFKLSNFHKSAERYSHYGTY